MEDLIKRLEAAEFGGFGFDSEVFIALNLTQPRLDGLASTTHPPITTSLDAALALAERLYPEGRLMVERTHEGRGWAMLQPGEYAKIRAMTDGGTPALALCIAILRAKLIDTAQNPR